MPVRRLVNVTCNRSLCKVMNRFFYNVFMYLATPFILLYLMYRALKSDDYRGRVGERFGFRKLTLTKPVILVHSVSVGETIAATPLILY